MQSDHMLETTLGAICAQQGGSIQTGPFGSQLHATDYTKLGTPVVMPADIIGGRISTDAIARVGDDHVLRLSQHKLRLNDIVFSRRGDVTRFARVTEREVGWLCGTGCLKVRAGRGKIALPEWVACALDSPAVKEWLIRHAVGATMPNLNTSILSAVPLEVPGIAEQREIVGLCFSLDDRIDLLRQTNATLESIAQALFKSWFIDFDPVRAKAEGREPEGMDAATAALFPSEFEESALGAIPKGWGVTPFSETVHVIGGGTPKTSVPEFWGGSVPWFSVVDAPVAGQVFTLSTEKSITEAGVANSSTKVLPAWSVIISARGTVGKLAMTACPMAMNQSCYGLIPKLPGTEPVVYLAAQLLVADLQRLAHGGVFDTITRDTLASVNVVQAIPSVTTAFSTLVRPIFERIQAGVRRIAVLEELRDTLLPRLISGKLRLPEAQAQIEEAMA